MRLPYARCFIVFLFFTMFYHNFLLSLLGRPERFSRDVFLIRHRIAELRRPNGAKLCTVISICVIFLMQV